MAELKFTVVSSYDNSGPFQYLAAQLVSIKDIFNEMIADSINIIDAKQKKLDDQIIKLQKSDSEEADIFYQHDYEGGRIKNLQMKEAVFQSSLIYFYSQFESALFEIVRICEKDLKFVPYTKYYDKCKKYRKGCVFLRFRTLSPELTGHLVLLKPDTLSCAKRTVHSSLFFA